MTARPLALALVGYGKMGRALETAALIRGHRIVARIDPHLPGSTHRELDPAALAEADLALEFTHGAAAPANVLALLGHGVPTVCGSTGWNDQLPAARARAEERQVGFLWAPNFSLGVNLLFRLVDLAAGAFGGLGGFEPYLVEEHHDRKLDAPSGTARRLLESLVERTPGKTGFGVAPAEGAVPPELVSTAWIRAGAIPGTHRIGWDASGETVEIVHTARSRAVFADGAVRAAEWLVGRRGPATIDEMFDDLLPSLAAGRKEP